LRLPTLRSSTRKKTTHPSTRRSATPPNHTHPFSIHPSHPPISHSSPLYSPPLVFVFHARTGLDGEVEWRGVRHLGLHRRQRALFVCVVVFVFVAWVGGWVFFLTKEREVYMDGWMDGWTYGWMDRSGRASSAHPQTNHLSSTRLSACMCASTHPSIHPSTHPSIHPSIHPPMCVCRARLYLPPSLTCSGSRGRKMCLRFSTPSITSKPVWIRWRRCGKRTHRNGTPVASSSAGWEGRGGDEVSEWWGQGLGEGVLGFHSRFHPEYNTIQ
jgi:hypothetical protein